MRLPELLLAGQVGWRGPGLEDTYVRELASLDDWIECLEAARKCYSVGSKAIPGGLTLEEALAVLGKRFLEAGVSAEWPPMGRPDPWPEGEEQRWIDAVFEAAERGSTHAVIDRWDGPTPVFRMTHTVLVEPSCRVPLADVPRSVR